MNNESNWPNRRLVLTVLLSANLLCFADRYLISAVIPGLRHDIFANPETYWAPVQWLIHVFQPWLGSNPENTLIGLLGMAFMLPYMIGSPFAAGMRTGRFYLIGIGLIVWSLASGGSGLATDYEWLLLTRCLVGVGEAAYGPIAPTVISDMFSPKMRATAMAIYAMMTPLGSAIGFGLGGYLMVKLGWRWPFYIMVAPGIILGILSFFLKDHHNPAAAVERKPTLRERVAEFSLFLRNRSFMYNMMASTAMTFAIGGVGFWIPSYIVEYRHSGSPEVVTLVFGGMLVLGGVGGTMVGGWLSDRMNRRNPRAYMTTSSYAMWLTLPFTVLMLYTPFPWAWGALGAACFFLFFNTGSAAAIITNVTPPHLRASAFAFSIFVTHALGDVVSPFIIGAIADGTGGNMNVAFLAVSASVGLAAILWWLGAPHLEADSIHSDK